MISLLALINFLIGLTYIVRNKKTHSRNFIFSSLLILLIGGSSCVSIKFKQKQSPQQKKPKEIKRNIAQELDFFQYEYRQA